MKKGKLLWKVVWKLLQKVNHKGYFRLKNGRDETTSGQNQYPKLIGEKWWRKIYKTQYKCKTE